MGGSRAVPKPDAGWIRGVRDRVVSVKRGEAGGSPHLTLTKHTHIHTAFRL